MRTNVWTAAALLVPMAAAAGATTKTWTFDGDAVDRVSDGFRFGRTGSGPPGHWVIKPKDDKRAAPGDRMLVQDDADATDHRFPIATTTDPAPANVRVSVKCKMVAGKVDQACGVVVRHRDENNYYVTRANALEGNVRFYYVKDGKRVQLASWKGRVERGEWHRLQVDAVGDRFRVSWDGKQVLEVRDTTFSEGGGVGVWTKADSVTYFDDLSMTPLRGEP